MQRGRGNPNRGAPTKEMYAQAIGVKFKAWRTLFSQEQFLATVAQIPAVKEELLDEWLEEKVKTTGRETFEAGWYQYYKIKRDVKAKEASIDQDFYKAFLMWLIGKGKPSDHEVTPWGREAHALQIPEVRALMDAFLDEISLVENVIAKLLFRGPQTLNEYFIYYKYILQHEKYMLVGDPWFFLEFKRYAGKLDSDGRASRMGESGRPIPDNQNWIEVRDVFAETGERNTELLTKIREDLGNYQSATHRVLEQLAELQAARRRGHAVTAAQEKEAWYSSSDEEYQTGQDTENPQIAKFDATLEKTNAVLEKTTEVIEKLSMKLGPSGGLPTPLPEPAAEPSPEVLPPELDLAALDNPTEPDLFDVPNPEMFGQAVPGPEEVLELRAVSPPPEK